MKTPRTKALYVLAADAFGLIYGPDERREIAALVDVVAPPQTRHVGSANPDILADYHRRFRYVLVTRRGSKLSLPGVRKLYRTINVRGVITRNVIR